MPLGKTLKEAAADTLTFIGQDMRKEINMDERMGFSLCMFVSEQVSYRPTHLAIHMQGDTRLGMVGVASVIANLAKNNEEALRDKLPAPLLDALAAKGTDAPKVASLSFILADIINNVDLSDQEQALLAQAIKVLVEKKP